MPLWVINALLPTNHNFFWHKERMFLLEVIFSFKRINVGRLMEREILACARRIVGDLFYLNLIRLLCEAKDVTRFDQEEEDFVLDLEVFLSFDEEVEENEEKKKKEEEKEAGKKTTVEKDPQGSAEMWMLLQQHILKQEAVWVFLKAAHEWYTKGFGETILPTPVCPNWVLPNVGPSGHAHEKPNVLVLDATKKKDATASATKHRATPRGKPVMFDDDEEDETLPMESDQNGSTSSTSPVSS